MAAHICAVAYRRGNTFSAMKHGGTKGLNWGALAGRGVGAMVGICLALVGGPAGLAVGGVTAGVLALRYGLMAGVAGAALGAGISLLRT